MSVTKVGTEFLVNTQTVNSQFDPTITGLQNGGFVVTWFDDSGTLGDSIGYSIKAKVFDAAGALVTDEFLVNTQTWDYQYDPTITGLQNGGFVVTWEDSSGPLGDGSGSSIKAKAFDAAGTPVTGEFVVNTFTGSNQLSPTITGLQNGGFVATWQDASGTLGDSSGTSIKAKAFDAAGTPVTGEFLVNNVTTNDQLVPTITGLQNGGFVVTWQDASGTLGDSSGYSIKAKVFDAAGAVVAHEFWVNNATANDQLNPTVTGLQNGGFVVTWQDYSGTMGDSSGSSIKAKVFNAAGAPVAIAGAPVAIEFLVNTQVANGQFFPTITGLQNGGFVVTWQDDSRTLGDSSNSSIKAKVFDAAGAVVTDEFLVNTQTANFQFHPTITGLQNGRFVVTWQDNSGTLGDNSGSSIKAQIFSVTSPPVVTASASTTAASEQVAIFVDNTMTVTDDDSTTLSSAAVSITGNFHSGEDVLAFANTNASTYGNIQATYNSGTGVLSLESSGATATVTQWQAALRAVTYTNTSDSPNTAARTISFVVNDGSIDNGAAAIHQVSVTAVNDAPVLAGDLAITVAEGGSVAVTTTDLTATDVDNSNSQLVYTLTAASHGMVLKSGATLALNGTFTQADLAANLISFQHDGAEVDGSFTVSLRDGTAAPQTATVNATVNPHLNDAPVLAGDLAITVAEGGSVAVTTTDLTATDVDNSNSQLVYTLTGTAHGMVLKSGATLALNGTFTQADLAASLISFRHDGGELNGSFTVSLTDETAAPQTATVNATVNPHVNDAPMSIGHNYTLSVDGPLTVAAAQGLLSGASDPENDPLSALLVSNPAHGTLSLNADGSFVYKAANTFFGEDSFSFKANDGALDSNVSTVKIDVTRETSSETTINPDGGSATTYYDAKNDEPWASQSHNFDSNGHETSATVSYDDGSVQGATFDANNDQPWKSQSSVTNVQGQVTNMGVFYDDGTQQVAIFDAGNNQPWLSQNAIYDALGRQTTLGVIYDDGSQQTAIFDAANNQLWSSQNMVYDVHGHLTNVGVIYDDLHTETAVYDVHSDQPWISQSAVYDPSGKLFATCVSYDDGHVENWHI